MSSSSPQSPFATAKEVAKLLSVSPSYVYSLLRQGILPGIRIGKCWRVDLRKLENFTLSQLPKPGQEDAQEAPEAEEGMDYPEVIQENMRLREIVAQQRTQIETLRQQLAKTPS